MKMYDAEISNLKNEWLLKGAKQAKANKLASLFSAIVISVGALFLAVNSVVADEAVLLFLCIVCIATAIGMWINWNKCKKLIAECDEEIEQRLQSGKLKKREYEKAFRPKTKKEKRRIAIGICCLAVIFVIVVMIGVACSSSGSSDDNYYSQIGAGGNRKGTQAEQEYIERNGLQDIYKNR